MHKYCIFREQLLAIVAALILLPAAKAQKPSPEVSSRTPVAQVGSETVYEDELTPQIEGQMRQLQAQEYEIKSKALDSVIDRKLLNAEAVRRKVTPEELLRQEADSKVADPTDEEVQALYNSQKDRLGKPLAEIRQQVFEAVKERKLNQARSEFYQTLRQKAQITVLLQPPRVNVSPDPSRIRGNPSAPVTIVEFSDFQCPYCRASYPVMKELLSKYGDRVRISYRDFPLAEIHSQAESAAEAARCAADQGKFWEYHDRLFETRQLDQLSLLSSAQELKLNMDQFSSCVKNREHKDQIQADFEDGVRAGITGTPGFFINGIAVTGALPIAEFEKVIDSELGSIKAANAKSLPAADPKR